MLLVVVVLLCHVISCCCIMYAFVIVLYVYVYILFVMSIVYRALLKTSLLTDAVFPLNSNSNSIHNFWLHKKTLICVCLMALVLEESILLVTLVHVLINIYDKSK